MTELERMFYVAMSSPTRGFAVVVDDTDNGGMDVEEFRNEYEPFEIRHVNHADMVRLMSEPEGDTP